MILLNTVRGVNHWAKIEAKRATSLPPIVQTLGQLGEHNFDYSERTEGTKV